MNVVGRTVLSVLGAWHGLSALQNTCELLAGFGLAPMLKPVAAKNLDLMKKLTAPLHFDEDALARLLVGVSLLESTAALAFVHGAVAGKRAEAGFALSLALFGAFFLIDDAFDDYELSAKHRAVFTMVAACYVVVVLADA